MLLLQCFSFSDWSLSLSQKEIYKISDYTFSLSLSKAVTSANSLKITYPADFSASSLAVATCKAVYNMNSLMTCTQNGLDLTVNKPFSSTLAIGQVIIFTISSVTNLSIAKTTATFKVYSLDSTGNIVESLTSGLYATYTAKLLSNFNIIPVVGNAGIGTTWTISTSLDYNLPSTGWISLQFPDWNTNFLPTTTQKKSFFTGVVECSIIMNEKLFDASCIVNGNLLVMYPSIDLVGSISFNASLPKNPPSTKPVVGVNVTIGTSEGTIEYYNNGQVASSIGCNISPQIVMSNETMSADSDYTFSFYTCNPVNSKTEIWIYVPTEITVAVSVVTGVFGFDNKYPGFSLSGQLVKVLAGFNSYWEPGRYLSFTLSLLKNPSSSLPSSTFEMYLKTDGYTSDYCNSGLSITSASGNLQVLSIIPTTYLVNATTTYTFTLQAESSIPSGSIIKIIFPSDLTSPDTSTTSLFFFSPSSISAFYSSNSNTLTITSAFPISILPTSFYFSINSITNPNSCKKTSAFLIQIYSGLSLLYQNSGFSITASPMNFAALSVNPSSWMTGEICIYAVSFSINVNIAEQVVVLFPSDISLTVVSTSCIFIKGFAANDVCVNTQESVSISVSQSMGNGEFQIGNMKNPVNTKACEVKIQLFTSDGYLIALGSVVISMQVLHPLVEAKAVPASWVVGEITSYTLQVSFYNSISATGLLVITSDLADLTKATCPSPFSCTYSSGLLVYLNGKYDTISITISNIVNPLSLSPFFLSITSQDSTYSFDTSSIPLTLQTPGAISISLTSNTTLISQSCQIYIDFKSKNILTETDPLTITLPGFSNLVYDSKTFTSSITLYPFTLGSISFTCKTPSISMSTLITLSTFHLDYMVDSGTVSFVTSCNVPCSACVTSPNTCTACIESFKYLYDDGTCHDTCPIGQTDIGNNICSVCALHCSECTSIDVCTICLSTYFLYKGTCIATCPLGTFENQFLCTDCNPQCATCTSSDVCTSCISLILYQNSCVSTCPVILIDKICYDCISPCYTCAYFPNSCTSCIENYSIYSNSCFSLCPDGTFQYADSCILCPISCKTCNSLTECVDCKAGSYNSNGVCISQCSSGFYYANEACLACGDQCKTCQDSADYCMDCINGVSYLGSCYEECPKNQTVLIGTQCIDCMSSCETCESNIYLCTSCPDGLFLFNNGCVKTCPNGFYSENSLCEPCDSSCKTCNSTDCFSCNYPYSLIENTCKECPDGSISVSDICVNCNTNCSTCINTTEICTSCNLGTYLYEGVCLALCPEGYAEIESLCVPAICGVNCTSDMLSNEICDIECDNEACNFDNLTCIHYITRVSINEEPMGFTTMAVGGSTITGIAAGVSSGSILPATISLSGALEWAGWVGVVIEVGKSQELYRRKLIDDGSSTIVKAFSVLFIILLLRSLINAIFLKKYLNLRKNDPEHLKWTQEHYWFWLGLCGFIGVISFKTIKVMLSGIFKLGIFTARFEYPAKLYLHLLIFSIVDLIIISIPMICILLYILSSYSTGTFVFVITLDVLIVTIISTFLSVFYMFKLGKQIKEKNRQRFMVNVAVPTAFEDLENVSEFSSQNGYENRYVVIKKYLDNLRGFEKNNRKKLISRCVSLDGKEENFTGKEREFLSFTQDIDNSMKINRSDHEDFEKSYDLESLKNANEFQENSVLSVSEIELEMQNNFDFIEIDEEDFEVVKVKCKDLPEMLVLKKSFTDGIVVNEFTEPLDPQPRIDLTEYEAVEVLKDIPSIGIFQHRITGEKIRVMRCFTEAKVVKKPRKHYGNYEFSLSSQRELADSTGVKSGHPLFWKFENPQITHGHLRTYNGPNMEILYSE